MSKRSVAEWLREVSSSITFDVEVAFQMKANGSPWHLHDAVAMASVAR